ncbi:MAG TPA: UDP-glucuronic acid decarboxylase family protein [Nitrospinota bacterium]|nr:UDP-glucuronic acid decarboxylase family protein [Nitrospinota bacterium]|tara:strand:- start:305451 stop:306395 length:945 start_codon:yes stop_codon:yes gene_type:complete
MARFVITGGAGFIGSHLCDRLLSEGNEVVAVDNLITGSVNNLNLAYKSKNFTFLETDVSKGLEMINGKVDYVMHFASPASPVDYLEFPIETMLVGSAGTHNTLELARQNKATFMLASTSEVYGDPSIHPQNEGYWGNVNPIGLRSCYDEAKRYSEAMTMAYHRVYSVDTRILRIFNTYGPRMRVKDGRAVCNFICQAEQGENITIYGDGSQTRSFCYVDDLVIGIIKLIYSGENMPVNLGNPTELSILDLAKLVLEKIETKSQIVQKPLPEDDPKVRQPDITRAKNILEWEPVVPLDEGLVKTIDYFSKILKGD